MKTEKTVNSREDMFVDEKVFLKYIPNFSNGITDKMHPEYGGLSNNARIGISAPVQTNRINVIFSKEELDILAVEFNDPTLVNNNSKFWKEFLVDELGMPVSIFPIYLKKEGMMLNKRFPSDYVYIKILKDSNIVGEGINNAKAIGAKFALIEEKDQFKKEETDRSEIKKAFKLYDKYEENEEVLRYLLSCVGKVAPMSAKLDFIQNEAWKEMNAKPTQFYGFLDDENLDIKIKVESFLRYKLINKVNSLYFFDKGKPIALDGDKNDVNGAAKFFASGIGQEEFLALKARLDIILKKEK